jgi:superfamily I DNA and/or RNA helicase
VSPEADCAPAQPIDPQGFDLNKSMFERLIMGGHPHKQLSLQHRMRPEISAIARHMTYPTLRDDPAMSLLARRPHVRGLASDVVFISHTVREDGAAQADAVTGFASVSKCNSYEADMVVQIVNYLLLQGYDADQLVVLTPYLGQLKVLRDQLSKSEVRYCDVLRSSSNMESTCLL